MYQPYNVATYTYATWSKPMHNDLYDLFEVDMTVFIWPDMGGNHIVS